MWSYVILAHLLGVDNSTFDRLSYPESKAFNPIEVPLFWETPPKPEIIPGSGGA